ncbi:AAA family ATPase [uncultured Maricaulis sp.]|uniref:AAA family ATPase n=1 Tax=uncultured Maricaulis sp. TaxID=174710 RepID=UPI0030D7F94A|tara:strand:+ start:51277 stop:53583 length:2307 start_codon:yes stop_codon:yes gene_type:complete
MFKKLIIRNVGVLKAFHTPDSPKLAPLTLFYARNGRGKSTLTSVMRAARDGSSSTVLGRRSLGNGSAAPEVTLVSDAGNIRFADEKWTPTDAPIEVFDTTFITDNIYAGELVELTHDRGLFSLIIGDVGVRLAKHLDRFNMLARRTATSLKEAKAALEDDIPSDISLIDFIALAPDAGLRKRLETAELELKGMQQVDKIVALKSLVDLPEPSFSVDLAAVLGKTIAEVETTARDRLLAHFRHFDFDKRGEAWINYGVEHIHDDACPFCGRENADEKGLVTLYSQIFSETYKNHVASITEAIDRLNESLGESPRSEVASNISANSEAVSKWAEFVAFDSALPDVSTLTALLTDAHKLAKSLLDQKRAAPLDEVDDSDRLVAAQLSLDRALSLAKQYNEAVAAINARTVAALAAAPATEAVAATARDALKKRILRHDVGVQRRADSYQTAERRDERARRIRSQVQGQLKAANESAAEHYHSRVNHYLSRFGATFHISEITNSMQGNSGQSDYRLVIKGETIARGRGRAQEAVPTFRNTLSAGDKATLAFSFFLAKLDGDPDLSRKTIVIDDPLSSHDSHRRGRTIEEIKSLCTRCAQVIVLSHDEFLLRDVGNRCIGVLSSAFEIEFEGRDQWSRATIADLDQLCRAKHAKLKDELSAFIDERKGNPDDIVLKLRRVLETHYRRSYSAYFCPDQNLGQIIRKISLVGTGHPCYRDFAKLENCNSATCDEHHGDNATIVPRLGIDPDELRVIAIDALELIGARIPEGASGG